MIQNYSTNPSIELEEEGIKRIKDKKYFFTASFWYEVVKTFLYRWQRCFKYVLGYKFRNAVQVYVIGTKNGLNDFVITIQIGFKKIQHCC